LEILIYDDENLIPEGLIPSLKHLELAMMGQVYTARTGVTFVVVIPIMGVPVSQHEKQVSTNSVNCYYTSISFKMLKKNLDICDANIRWNLKNV